MKEIYLVIILYLLGFYRVYIHLNYDPHPERNRWGATGAGVRTIIDSVLWAGLAALVVIYFIGRPFLIPSESMLPTLEVGDRLIANRAVYLMAEPSRNDIVIFRPPAETYRSDKEILIKRCIALAGDIIEIRDGALYRNEQKVTEQYIREPMLGSYDKFTVPEGHIFCLGDNRNNSQDSRVYGPVPVANVIGRADFIFWPIRRWRTFRKTPSS